MPKQKYWDGSTWQEIGASANKVTLNDPGNVINSVEVESALQEIVKNPSNVQKVPTATGTGTAIILATDKGSFLLSDGYSVTFKASANNSGSATTVNIDGKGAKSLYKPETTTAPTLITNKYYTIVYNSSSNCFFIKASATGTATAAQVLAGAIFSNENDTDLVGAIPSKSAATYTPGATSQAISSGQYLSGTQTISAVSFDATKVLTGTTIAGTAGNMPNRGAVNQSLAINGSYTIPDGYHSGAGKVTQSITTKVAATYTPSQSTQTIAAGQYLSGAQTISAVSFDATKVLTGTTIAGKAGTMPNNGSQVATLNITGSTKPTKSIPAGYTTGGTVTAQIDASQAGNIKQNVNLAGCVGTLVPLTTEKRWASGTAQSAGYRGMKNVITNENDSIPYVTVSGLAFNPTCVFMHNGAGKYTLAYSTSKICFIVNDSSTFSSIPLGIAAYRTDADENHMSMGFSLPILQGTTLSWIAVE